MADYRIYWDTAGRSLLRDRPVEHGCGGLEDVWRSEKDFYEKAIKARIAKRGVFANPLIKPAAQRNMGLGQRWMSGSRKRRRCIRF
jgi:hypothetical protein